MAELVMAYCASNAPMVWTDRMEASDTQRDKFFGALSRIKVEALEYGVEAVVLLTNEHFTNFFLENVPQLCVGLGEENWCSTKEWLPTEKALIPGHPGLASHIVESVLRSGFDPAFSHRLELGDQGMAVYCELDPGLQLPLIPILQNCTVHPMLSTRRAFQFGVALGESIRSYSGLKRVALVGAGGLSHSVGTPQEGGIDEDFDRWFLTHLEEGALEDVFDLTDEQIEVAGNGAHEIRNWLGVAGAMAPLKATELCYEAVHPWSTGMGVAKWKIGAGSKLL